MEFGLFTFDMFFILILGFIFPVMFFYKMIRSKKIKEKLFFLLFFIISLLFGILKLYSPAVTNNLLDNLQSKNVKSIYIGKQKLDKDKIIPLLNNNKWVSLTKGTYETHGYKRGTKLFINFIDNRQEKFTILYNDIEKYIVLKNATDYTNIPKFYQTLKDLKIDVSIFGFSIKDSKKISFYKVKKCDLSEKKKAIEVLDTKKDITIFLNKFFNDFSVSNLDKNNWLKSWPATFIMEVKGERNTVNFCLGFNRKYQAEIHLFNFSEYSIKSKKLKFYLRYLYMKVRK